MTCKDCIHYDICGRSMINSFDSIMDSCPHFKDKFKFIELPCQVGDTVWIIWQGFDEPKIRKDSVWCFTVFSDEIGYETDHLSGGVYGKNLFSTREDAEKALKEREKNEKT